MIKEQLGQETQALAIDLVLAAVNFKDGDGRVCDAILRISCLARLFGGRPINFVPCSNEAWYEPDVLILNFICHWNLDPTIRM